MRAAVIVVTPMPSPRKRMTFLALRLSGWIRALKSTSARPRAKKVSFVSMDDDGAGAEAGGGGVVWQPSARLEARMAARARLLCMVGLPLVVRGGAYRTDR